MTDATRFLSGVLSGAVAVQVGNALYLHSGDWFVAAIATAVIGAIFIAVVQAATE